MGVWQVKRFTRLDAWVFLGRYGYSGPMSEPAPDRDAVTELLQWTLADRLRKVRREIARMEQRPFAELLGISKETYTAWETGRNEPKNLVSIARRIEVLTGAPAAWLLGVDIPVQGSGSSATIGATIPQKSHALLHLGSSSSLAGESECNYPTDLAPVIDLADRRARRNPEQAPAGAVVARCAE